MCFIAPAGSMQHGCSLLVVLTLAATSWVAAQDAQPPAAGAARFDKYVHVVYFTPADRDPLPGFGERLDRILTDIQCFYRKGMARNGYGPLTFPLQRDGDGRLIIHVVRSRGPYGRGEGATTDDIRQQVREALLGKGIDIDREHVIIFQNLLLIEGNKIRTLADYTYGGLGNHVCGTAWVTDHPLEDTLNLDKEEPVLDAHGRELKLCDYVVAEMGGIAHELGHALGLPHDLETPEERETLGIALMGNGNFEYGRERTPQGGKGAFLSKSEATVLSSHPLFKRDTSDINTPLECEFDDVSCTKSDEWLVLSGSVHSNIRPYAVVAYHDPLAVAMDYDASSWVSEIDAQGHFEVRVGELRPGPHELRLRCCCVNGAEQTIEFQYALDDSLNLPAASFRRQFLYRRYIDPAREAPDSAKVLAGLEKLKGEDDRWYRKALVVHRLLTRGAQLLPSPAALGDEVREVWLSAVRWESASVNGAEPTYDGSPDAVPLESAERVHEHGIYAPASSSYAYRLGGKWKRFESYYGLQEWTSGGSVVFVIKCDGQERLRSPTICHTHEGHAELDVRGVERLELIVEDGGDDEWDDNSNWLSPRLSR
ncbi:MAG: NPCBM/NEW2 domain-containing protein [Planctomycetota bacterium]